jgi:hypothetical protein
MWWGGEQTPEPREGSMRGKHWKTGWARGAQDEGRIDQGRVTHKLNNTMGMPPPPINEGRVIEEGKGPVRSRWLHCDRLHSWCSPQTSILVQPGQDTRVHVYNSPRITVKETVLHNYKWKGTVRRLFKNPKTRQLTVMAIPAEGESVQNVKFTIQKNKIQS